MLFICTPAATGPNRTLSRRTDLYAESLVASTLNISFITGEYTNYKFKYDHLNIQGTLLLSVTGNTVGVISND
jgi:hypothetical protein